MRAVACVYTRLLYDGVRVVYVCVCVRVRDNVRWMEMCVRVRLRHKGCEVRLCTEDGLTFGLNSSMYTVDV